MIYTRVLNKGGRGVRSPVDGPWAGLCSLHESWRGISRIGKNVLIGKALALAISSDGNLLSRKQRAVFLVLYRLYKHS